MTTLVIEELLDTLYQDFTVKVNTIVDSIRLNLYMHNSPSGTFTVNLKEDATTIATKAYTAAEIETLAGFTANQYHHGYFTFEFDSHYPIKRNTTYRIELTSSGYSFSESAYIAWIRPHENGFNNSTIDLTDAANNPFGYQVWSL